MLLIWIKADGDIGAAVADARAKKLFVDGERVLCAEWLGDGEPPAPKWSRDFPRELSPEEQTYCVQTLEKRFPVSFRAQSRYPEGIKDVRNLSDDKLWHLTLGVQTEPMNDQQRAAVAAGMRADT